MGESIGLITGNGRLPFVLADQARKTGHRVFICAIQGETDVGIESLSEATEWIRLGELGRVIQFFKRYGVKKAVMAGKVTKTNLFRGEVRPDLETIKVLAGLRNHSDDSLLGGIARYLRSKGVELLETSALLDKESLPREGILTKKKPSKEELEDIHFGWELAKEMGRLDVGQTVVVRQKAVLAVEAIEGTDEAIRRGGKLGNGGVTVVKVAKPNQDMRFDVPTVGLTTLEAMIEVKARALAFEAGKTIVLDRNTFIEKANQHKLVVMAVK